MPGVAAPEAGFAAGLLIRTQFVCESPAFLNARVSHLALRAEVLDGGFCKHTIGGFAVKRCPFDSHWIERRTPNASGVRKLTILRSQALEISFPPCRSLVDFNLVN